MAFAVSNDVVSAILSGQTAITRRVEIFESDGDTIWSDSQDTPRVIGGEVSVDGERDERRSLNNLQFDNSDGVLDHDPEGFWYDKIIKAHRGIIYPNTKRSPAIAVMRIHPHLR